MPAAVCPGRGKAEARREPRNGRRFVSAVSGSWVGCVRRQVSPTARCCLLGGRGGVRWASRSRGGRAPPPPPAGGGPPPPPRGRGGGGPPHATPTGRPTWSSLCKRRSGVSVQMSSSSFFFIFYFFSTFIYFWDTERQSMNGGGAERGGGHRIGSRLQVLSHQPRA